MVRYLTTNGSRDRPLFAPFALRYRRVNGFFVFMMNDLLPRVRRDLELFPVQHQGERFILVRDHLGLVQEGTAIPDSVYRILALLESARSIVELQTYFIRQAGGALVGSDEIRALIARLDETFLLDSESFRAARQRVIDDFAAQPVRRCSHAGSAYPARPEELNARLEEILSSLSAVESSNGPVKALVSPHIDLAAGKKGYAAAYRNLAGARPSKVILLGVGHRLGDGLFCLTEKDFETPLGRVRSDREIVRRLGSADPKVLSGDDFVHRSEHSIEFQILFLQHLLPADSFTIVPILCGSIQSGAPEYRRAAYLSHVGPFAEVLRECLEGPGETLLVAGVDLSHIGPKFGHDTTASAMEADASLHDRALLDAVCRRDPEQFWEESIRVKDRFNVCGFSALALMLEVLPPAKGELLHYEVWHEGPTRSAVSFAAAAFREK